jgi:hypothetical protein
MNEQNVVELEPLLQSRSVRDRSDTQLRKADLNDIMGCETLVLATAVAQAILSGMERRDKRKERRFLIVVTLGLAFLIGMIRLVMKPLV